MEKEMQMPKSTMEDGPFAQSPAFEIRQGKLVIKFEPDIPYVTHGGNEFAVMEAPSLVVGGKKIPVAEIL
jgi:hypothetical protein